MSSLLTPSSPLSPPFPMVFNSECRSINGTLCCPNEISKMRQHQNFSFFQVNLGITPRNTTFPPAQPRYFSTSRQAYQGHSQLPARHWTAKLFPHRQESVWLAWLDGDVRWRAWSDARHTSTSPAELVIVR